MAAGDWNGHNQPTVRRIAVAKKKAKKPEWYKAFDELTRKLIQVPKKEVDRRIARRKHK